MGPSDQPPSAATESLEWLRRLDGVDPCQTQQAWTEFLHGYSRVLMQVISICERDAENRQECFVYACEQLCRKRFHRLRQFQREGPASFPTWLRAVVRNLCVDWQRRRRRREGSGTIAKPLEVGHAHLQSCIKQLEESTASELGNESYAAEQIRDSSPDPETLAVRREEGLALGFGLRCLTAKQRLALRLRFQQELTLQEIAPLVGLKNAQAADRFLQEIIIQLQTARRNFFGKTKAASV